MPLLHQRSPNSTFTNHPTSGLVSSWIHNERVFLGGSQCLHDSSSLWTASLGWKPPPCAACRRVRILMSACLSGWWTHCPHSGPETVCRCSLRARVSSSCVSSPTYCICSADGRSLLWPQTSECSSHDLSQRLLPLCTWTLLCTVTWHVAAFTH